MKKFASKNALTTNPDEYVAGLDGWQRLLVEKLRKAVRTSKTLEEVVKWRNLVYLSNGPVLVIRAEESRVLFGFWRGQRLREIEPTLKPGGKYEMATIELKEGMELKPSLIKRLVKEAITLNETLGDPTLDAKKG